MEKEKSFLGRGWSFPPEFNKADHSAKMIADEEDIENSLHVLLSTRLGERIMQPRYGCNLDHLMFENINLTTKTYVRDLIETAILYHEPRIDVEHIQIDTTDELKGIIRIKIEYIVRSTNTRRNLVYPFYKTEATDI